MFNAAQSSIIKSLRYAATARYSQLMRPTGLESDSFKFQLRKLIAAGLVEKLEPGLYRLTARGKEIANDLDESGVTAQKRPKLSLFLLLDQPGVAGSFLMQKRQRNPYMGYWGVISGPVQWGESFEAAAQRELRKQAGLTASFSARSFVRVRDYAAADRQLLEDKLFVVMHGQHPSGQLDANWPGGHSRWMSLDELLATSRFFPSTPSIIQASLAGQTYLELDQIYDEAAY